MNKNTLNPKQNTFSIKGLALALDWIVYPPAFAEAAKRRQVRNEMKAGFVVLRPSREAACQMYIKTITLLSPP